MASANDWRRALHEAAHATIADALGLIVVRLSMRSCAYLIVADTPATRHADIVALLAGALAEREFFGSARPGSGRDDRRQITRALAKCCHRRGAQHRRCLEQFSRAIVKRHRRRITRIARALLERSTLTAREFASLQ